ncbi:hypothetical protein L7F22_068712 [Adiantum nelumboides]|nr:hypothetical protein [Adiantum nelumboides]
MVLTIKGLPPGSLGWPIVGQTLQYMRASDTQQLEPFLQQGRKRYGKIFRASLYGNWTIVSTDVDVNKFVLQNEGRLFKGYWPKSFYKLFGRYSVGMVTGDQHKLYRSLIVNYLGAGKSKMALMIPTVEAIALSIMQNWKHDAEINVLEMSHNYIFGVLCKKVLSLNEEDAHFFHELYKFYEAGLFAFPLELPGTKYTRALQARVKMVQLFKRIIKERREQPNEKHNDMLDYFLSQNVEGICDEVIYDNLSIMFFAGEDTTAKTLATIIKILKDYPLIYEEVLKEQNRILASKGDRKDLNMDDYLQMTVTQYVISEALRTANPSLGLFRIALQDVWIKGGYKIPKGWKVYVSQSSANLDPNPFPNPTSFDPFRWKDSRSYNLHDINRPCSYVTT